MGVSRGAQLRAFMLLDVVFEEDDGNRYSNLHIQP